MLEKSEESRMGVGVIKKTKKWEKTKIQRRWERKKMLECKEKGKEGKDRERESD